MFSFFTPDFLKIIIALFVSSVVASVLYQTLMRQLDAQNLMNTTDDINQYPNDQHIAYPQGIAGSVRLVSGRGRAL